MAVVPRTHLGDIHNRLASGATPRFAYAVIYEHVSIRYLGFGVYLSRCSVFVKKFLRV